MRTWTSLRRAPEWPLDGAGWVARVHAGRLSAAERRALREWLAASSDHARDLLRSEAVWRLSGGLGSDADVQAELDCIPPRATSRMGTAWHWSLAGAVVLALCTVLSFVWLSRADWYETAPGEQRMVTLADGSTVAINTATRVGVEFSAEERRILLERGEALFDVAHDGKRPFVVRAGHGSVRAVGTRFNVLLDSQQTVTVAVLEGRVELKARTVEGPAPTLLSAGQSAAWERNGELVAAAPERASRERIVAWREGKLRFDAWPLARAIEEHNRYAARPIRLEGDVPGDTAVSGVFRIGDTAALIEALRDLMDVEAVDSGEAWVLVRRPSPLSTSPSAD